MGLFGWSLPPGCHSLPGDGPTGPCPVCGQTVDDCLCLECPTCGSQGDVRCYREHGLIRTPEQIAAKAEADASAVAEAAAESEYLDRWAAEEAAANEHHA